ncbi:UbiA-like protein EboC [Sphingobacterium sp. SG20118]|uniref:UbiA-like protein EboC n=1 Tax=Sphingobacterium TaxID=28453 RepID=UPI002468694E|nr:UbiA-like protein EboC [Sphingobacterium faecium]MDH5825704.1 UbiA-like protein EboC [Sphingobacterium faecium]
MEKLIGYIRLMRPANVVTAVADVLAGIAISGYLLTIGWEDPLPIILLCISTIGLYSGGIIFNDVFDANLDRVERPERPIPSGLISERGATIFGAIFFLIGVGTATFIGATTTVLAISIMVACLLYNKWAKHHAILGPLNMGLCRGLNLLLGVSIISSEVSQWWFLAIVPIIYIASITMISRDEVHGGSKRMLYFAAILYAFVIACILFFAVRKGDIAVTLLFLAPFAWMIFKPLIKAINNPIGPNIGKAVKAGVIALILMNAAWASVFADWKIALTIIFLLPLSILLSKAFAVT